MLNLTCHEFRSHFLPGATASHRASCAACDSWAERIELTLTPGPAQGMPPGLADRLRRIAQGEDCRWVEESWRDLIDGLLPPDQHKRHEEHLRRCDRCREMVVSLQCFLEEARQPLPERLVRRLRDIPPGERRRPPIWIRQTRYAAAASYLLVVLIYQVVGNPVAATREKLDPIRDNAAAVLITSKASLTDHSKAAYASSTTRWSEYRTELWKNTRAWAKDISASWSRPESEDEDEKEGPSGDRENDAP